MAVSPSHSKQPDPYKSYTSHDSHTAKTRAVDNGNININVQQKRLTSFKSLSSLRDTSGPAPYLSSMSPPSTAQSSSTSQSGGKKFKQFLQKIGKKNSSNGTNLPTSTRADSAATLDTAPAALSETQAQGKANRKIEGDTSLISEQSWGPGPGFSPDPVGGIPLLEQAEQDYHGQNYGSHLGENGISQHQLYIPATPTSPRFAHALENGELSQIQEEQGGDRTSEIACSSPKSEITGSGIRDLPTPAVVGISSKDTDDVTRLPLTPVSTQYPAYSEHHSQQSSRTAEYLADKPLPSSPRSNTAKSTTSGLPLVTTPSTIGNASLEHPSNISYFGRGSTRSDRLNSYSTSTDQASLTSGSVTGHYTVHHQTSQVLNGHGQSDRQETARSAQYISTLAGPTPSSTSFKTRLFPSFGLTGKQQTTSTGDSVSSVAQKKTNKAEKFKTLGRLGHPANTAHNAKRNPTAPVLAAPAAHTQAETFSPSPVAHEPLRASPTEEKTTFARRLIRRVASAPNAKGLFTASGGTLGGSGVFSVGSGNSTQVATPPIMTPTGYPNSSLNNSSAQFDTPNLTNLEISDEPESEPQLSQSPRNVFPTFHRKQTSPSTYSPQQMSSQASLPKSPVMSSPYLAASTSTLGSTSTGAQASGRGLGAMGAREGRANSVGVLQHKGSSGNLLGINGIPIGNGKPVRPNALTVEQGKGSFRRTYSSNSIRTKTVC